MISNWTEIEMKEASQLKEMLPFMVAGPTPGPFRDQAVISVDSAQSSQTKLERELIIKCQKKSSYWAGDQHHKSENQGKATYSKKSTVHILEKEMHDLLR